MRKIIARFIWNTTEFFNISLGKYTHCVFEMMTENSGSKKVSQKEQQEIDSE